MKLSLFLVLIFQAFILTNTWSKNLEAHVHGSVQLDIATDKDQLLVMLKSPSESFLGFEYKAQSREDKELVKNVKYQWDKKLLDYLGPQKLKDCKITSSNWKQQFSGKNHSNIIAESYIQCTNKLAGMLLQVSFKKSYNHIQEINLQLMREDGTVLDKKDTTDIFSIKL